MTSITSVATNMKCNGTRLEFYKPNWGIRQGDLISLYLFVICIDKLSHLISYSMEQAFWKTMKVGRNGSLISHLMFEDDILLFCQAKEVQIQCVFNIVNQF